jgi:tRNA-modifying protein YgfZ
MSVMNLADLLTTAVFSPHHPRGLLEISGSSRLDLLDRMSTNRLKQLTTGQGVATVLTSDIGRTIDRLLVYAGADAIRVLTGGDNGDNIARYLMRFVFFNDDFRMLDKSADYLVLGVYGGKSTAVLTSLGFPSELISQLPLHHWQPHPNHPSLSLHRTDPLASDSYYLILPQTESEHWQQQLTSAGAQAISPADYEQLRVQAGLPQLGHELSLDYIPLESNLWADVSFNKGCYVGQEIIARMESRGKLAKKLVQFHLPAGHTLTAGAEIMADGRAVGSLTSVAGEYGLGYLKSSVLPSPPPLTAVDYPLQLTQIYERTP